jgi:ABC-type dipeptide/oligopeptide/nickel transport system permease component
MSKRITHFLRTLIVLVLFGAAAVTGTFYLVGQADELAEDRLLPGGENLPPPEPFAARYERWLRTVLGSGFTDFGQSRKVVVKSLLADRLPVTVAIGGISWLLAWGLGLAIAIALATRWRAFASLHQKRIYPLAQAVPSLLIVILFYLLLLHLEPNSSRGLRTVVGIAALVLLMTPTTTALWYNGVARVLESEYVRAARARGIAPRTLWLRHVIPNVLVSSGVLTLAAFSLAGLVVGSAFVEGVFRLGGVAEAFIEGTRLGQAELCGFATLAYFLVLATGVLLSELMVLLLDPQGGAIT